MCVIWFICLHSGWLGLQSTDTECLPAKFSCKEICTKWCRTLTFSTSLSQSSFHLTVDGKVQSPNLSLFVLWLICILVVKKISGVSNNCSLLSFLCMHFIASYQLVRQCIDEGHHMIEAWSIEASVLHFYCWHWTFFFLIKNANKWNIRYTYT